MSRFSLYEDAHQIQHCLSNMLSFLHCVFSALLWKMNWLEIHGFFSGFFLSCAFTLYSVFTPTAGSLHSFSQWCSWPSTPVGSTLKDSSADYRFHMCGRLSLPLVLITTTSTAHTVHSVSGVTTNVERGEACFNRKSTSCRMRDLTDFPHWYLQKTLQPVFYGYFNHF